ncbi:ComF family protein [Nitratiruptor sp. YY09-18]|uniref:ComF family protein n=1 Tax=Nitratiruptor sp. YY09-18 TaxID=2724901 RepID=UPI001915D03F|nr:ComF family protein [Nitratiruptor sp. YY09-18]BCD67594.1 competence protein ComFC [Nitratiruptor sp. YY09-18]
MRCLVCGAFSLPHICKKCQKTLLAPNLHKRQIFKGFYVYSFYSFEEIEDLLHLKYHHVGKYIYKILAQNSLQKFSQEFCYPAALVPVDAKITQYGYSHTAILAKALGSKYLKPHFNALYASNSVSYAGKSLEYRLAHPRQFRYKGGLGEVIVVDDVITTGTTLKEAKSAIEATGDKVLFAITLADAARSDS